MCVCMGEREISRNLSILDDMVTFRLKAKYDFVSHDYGKPLNDGKFIFGFIYFVFYFSYITLKK